MTALITATCPECMTVYRLAPDMAGKRMRCTNSSCREVFAVNGPEPVAEDLPPTMVAATPPEFAPPVFDWRDAPPPVQGDPEREAVAVAERPATAPRVTTFVPPPPRRNRNKWWLTGAGVVAFVGVTWVGATLFRTFAQAEQQLTAAAETSFSAGRFGEAATKFQALLEKYPNHVRANEYRFLGALAAMRRQVGAAPPEPQAALQELSKFLDDHGNGPFLAARRLDVYEAGLKVLDDLTAEVETQLGSRPPDLEAASKNELGIQRAFLVLERHSPTGTDLGTARSKLIRATQQLALARAKSAARTEVLALLAKPRPDLDAARDLIRRAGFANDAEITAAWSRAEDTLRKLVAYRALNRAPEKTQPATSGGWLPEPRGVAGPGPRVPALAHGILAALDAKTGRLAWADRINLDAAGPVLNIDNEVWLVVSTDPPAVSARETATGAVRWRQPLDTPPVGPPVLLNGHVYLALGGVTGQVLDIDARTGTLFGQIETGQPLAAGIGVGGNRLYVPAVAQQVYVLEIGGDGEHGAHCVATLATGHAPGSLRGPPVVLPSGDGPPEFSLLMGEGRGDTALVLFQPTPNHSLPAPVRVRLPGWTWFPPHVDAERLIAVTDRGALGVFGLRRAGSLDPPLFPSIEERTSPSAEPPSRAIVAHADTGGIVVLSEGRLRQWRLGIDRKLGQQLKPGWSLAEPLGAALQPPLLDESRVLHLITQRTQPPAVLATAVRISTGELVWQRPVGLSPTAKLVALGDGAVSIDPHGSVLALTNAAPNSTGWQFGGREVAGPVHGGTAPAIILPMPAGVAVVQALAKGAVIRRIAADSSVQETRIDLPAPLAGTPGVGPHAAVLPLANGQLVRLSGDGKLTAGPSWRSSRSTGAGQVTHWHGDDYLVTDGSRRLTRLSWPTGPDYDLQARAVERPHLLLGAPVIVPGDEPRAVIADAGGTLTLVRGNNFIVERTWKLGGEGRRITAGPALVGWRIVVVVNHSDVIVLDPQKETAAGTFTVSESAAIGLPAPFGNDWVLADTSGRLWRLDPATGQPRGKPFLLPASVAAATPCAIGKDLFVPLADGSAIILSPAQLAETPR